LFVASINQKSIKIFMKFTVRKKWILGVTVTLVLISMAVYMFYRYEIDHVLGGNTAVVDASQFKALSERFAITNVNVLSADSESMNPNQTVLIKDQKIESIGTNISIPDTYHVINATGQYLIPGLVDSHVHIKKSENDLLQYIANGITHIGEMTGMKEHFQYRKQINNGAIGPEMYIASPKVTSQEGMKPTFRSWFEKRHQNYTTPLEGRKAVRKYKAMGYNAIKLSSDLDAEIYAAINDEAKKLGIPVIGHLPFGIELEDLYQSEQSQLAHITSITHSILYDFGGISPENAEDFLQYFRQNADSIAMKLKEKNIVVSSTIWLNESVSKQDFDLPNFLKTIELEYMNPGWVEGSFVSRGWLPGNSSYENPDNTDPESKRFSEIYWNTYVEAMHIVTRALFRNGVLVTAGTDANGACGVIPGFSLHDELESLSNLGLSNAQVLHSATVAPAKWMQSNAGKIEVGYRADLVLLDENPLEDIRNTRAINAVVANGKLLDRAVLDKMLQSIKEANNKSRKISIDEFLN
jgi:hypothetical protein